MFSKTLEKTQQLNASEAHNLWDLLKSNYLAIELMQIWENYAHDAEFKLLIRMFIRDFEKDVKKLEGELKKFGISGPDKNRAAVNTSANTEVLYDETLAQEFFVFAQENVEQLLRAIRTTTTNDEIRKFFINFAHKAVERLDHVVSYLKLKGWLDTPPMYLQTPPDIPQRLGAGGAFHLWDHLTFRYDNISQTEVFHAFAKDPEFKAILKIGLQTTLKKQVATLEKECNKHGIPLPRRPKNFAIPDKTEIFEDDYMYRLLINGIQGAAIFHAQALKQSTTEDNLRKLF